MAKKDNSAAKKTKPTMLAYQRSNSPTDAVFQTFVNGQIVPVEVREKATLGTQSQYMADDAEVPAYGNPQRVEVAALPLGSDTLLIDWRMTVIPASLAPHSCDLPVWRQRLSDFTKAYAEAGGYLELGRRYAANVANGRWAYKNRLFASSFTVSVTAHAFPVEHTNPRETKTFSFDALSYPLNTLARDETIDALGAIIAQGLSGACKMVRIEVRGELDMGDGAVVYPSQEFAEKETAKGAVGKVLYGVPKTGVERCAAFHEQKIGAAIRTIDTWHGGLKEDGEALVEATKPLPVNPYAQDRDTHTVVRERKHKTDLYTILDKQLAALLEKARAGEVTDEMHFVVANLVRGGVFGMKSASEKTGEDVSLTEEPDLIGA
ncbi:MAG: type I-F CRISPR-associated protein Csy3 [Alphaproteobacteria bacterium]